MALQPTYPELRTLPKMIAFLEEKLSDTEMEQVEQIIEEDELYAYALESLHQAILKRENVEAVASQFQDVFVKTIREEAKPEAKKIIFPVWRVVAVAAAVVILALLFIPEDQVVEPQVSPYEPRITIRSSNQDIEINEFLTAYNQKDYQNAILLGENIINDTISDSPNLLDELHLSLGFSHFELNNLDQAIPLLEKALNSDEGRIRSEARWFLALVYLKGENFDSTKKYLREIDLSEAGKSRYEAAQEVLEDIR